MPHPAPTPEVRPIPEAAHGVVATITPPAAGNAGCTATPRQALSSAYRQLYDLRHVQFAIRRKRRSGIFAQVLRRRAQSRAFGVDAACGCEAEGMPAEVAVEVSPTRFTCSSRAARPGALSKSYTGSGGEPAASCAMNSRPYVLACRRFGAQLLRGNRRCRSRSHYQAL